MLFYFIFFFFCYKNFTGTSIADAIKLHVLYPPIAFTRTRPCTPQSLGSLVYSKTSLNEHREISLRLWVYTSPSIKLCPSNTPGSDHDTDIGFPTHPRPVGLVHFSPVPVRLFLSEIRSPPAPLPRCSQSWASLVIFFFF